MLKDYTWMVSPHRGDTWLGNGSDNEPIKVQNHAVAHLQSCGWITIYDLVRIKFAELQKHQQQFDDLVKKVYDIDKR